MIDSVGFLMECVKLSHSFAVHVVFLLVHFHVP